MSVLDKLVSIRNWGRFFTNGWGPVDLLATAHNWARREQRQPGHFVRTVARGTMPRVMVDDRPVRELSRMTRVLRGRFRSPLAEFLPTESRIADFDLVLPAARSEHKPPFNMAVLLAATGDEDGRLRFRAAEPLARKHGVASVVLNNPFYGRRRPDGQNACYLRHVTDILAMGAALITECTVLVDWARQSQSQLLRPEVVLGGASMGGIMAWLAASGMADPHVTVAAQVAPHSAAPVFTQGLLSKSVDWTALRRDREVIGNNEDAVDLLPSDLRRLWLDSSIDERQLLHAVLDFTTDTRNFPPPPSSDRAVVVAASDDLYVLDGAHILGQESMPGAEVRVVDSGHVLGVLNWRWLEQAVVDAAHRVRDNNR